MKLRISFIPLFTLTLFNFLHVINCKHIEILSINDFNHIINSSPNSIIVNDSATYPHNTTINVIKYYTTWCNHCKRLAPTWSNLIKSFPNINFLSVDCDVFGKTLCKNIPGYPIIKIVTTQPSDIINLSDTIDSNTSDDLSWFEYLKSWFMNDSYNTKVIDIGSDRIIEYKGVRDFQHLYNFIDSFVQLTQLEYQFNRIVYGNDSGLDSDLLDSYFYQYLLLNNIVSIDFTSDDDAAANVNANNNDFGGKVNSLQVSDIGLLNKERHKLENIVRNNHNSTELINIKNKLHFLNWLEDQVETSTNNQANNESPSHMKDEL